MMRTHVRLSRPTAEAIHLARRAVGTERWTRSIDPRVRWGITHSRSKGALMIVRLLSLLILVAIGVSARARPGRS